jgi:hypothetical protein
MFGVTSAYARRTGALPAAGRDFGRKVEKHLNKNKNKNKYSSALRNGCTSKVVIVDMIGL